jgi:hypothetical protein
MKITVSKIKRELIKRGWSEAALDSNHAAMSLIKDVKEIVEEIIKEQRKT